MGDEAQSCPAGFEVCGGACVNLRLDPDHCGACDSPCPAGLLCSKAQCATECQGGTTQCGELCADTAVDPMNCGDCGNVCAAGDACTNSSCALQCGGGTTQCGADCVDTHLDPNHCGRCDNACPGSDCIAGECGDAPSCKRLLASDPALTSGLYFIDPDGASGNAPFQVWCDMEGHGGGWTRVANITEPNVNLSAATYLAGVGDVAAQSYVHACTKFAGLFGEDSVARVTMGMAVDFYMPVRGNDLCAMLQSNQLHRWSATAMGVFTAPVYNPTAGLLGGSNSGYPTDGRTYLAFWGGNGANSGCCHATYGDGPAWNRAFTLDVREP